jgi:hypothetical protein
MSEQTYLKPKVSTGNMDTKQKKRGMFVGNAPYPELGGFTSASKLGKGENMAIEKGGPSAVKGKPI